MSKAAPFSCCLLFVSGLFTAVCQAAGPGETVDLRPRIDSKSLTRVTIELDAGGNDLVRAATGATGAATTAATEQKLPMSVAAELQYDERRIAAEGDAATSSTPLAVRYYRVAEATLKIDTSGLAPKLADDRRMIVVEAGDARPNLWSPNGPLTREQLDLIDLAGNTYLIDQLLPATPVANGATWSHNSALMGGLLALDSVAVCEVQSVLDEFNASFAKIRLAGVVHGTADGAATEREVRGVYLFDRRQGRITRMNLAVRESRSIGGATPGLQGVGKMQIRIDPLASSPELTDDIVAAAANSSRTPSLDLIYESIPLKFRTTHDRQWFITGEGRETLTLRRVDDSGLVAQCTVTKLPPKSLGRQVPLEQFQKDVAYSLGKSFGQFISGRQWTNAAGHHCFEVIARGTVEDLPVEWHYFLVAPDSGHRVSLAFMMEGPMVARLNQADRRLVENIELIEGQNPPQQTAARSTETTK